MNENNLEIPKFLKRKKFAYPSITWAKVENRIEELKTVSAEVLNSKITENIYNIKNFYFEHRYLEHINSENLFKIRKKCDEFLADKIKMKFKSNDNSVCYGLGEILYENLDITLMDAGNPNVWTFLSTCFGSCVGNHSARPQGAFRNLNLF